MKMVATINVMGSLTALASWLGVVTPILGFVAGICGVVAGIVLVTTKIRDLKAAGLRKKQAEIELAKAQRHQND